MGVAKKFKFDFHQWHYHQNRWWNKRGMKMEREMLKVFDGEGLDYWLKGSHELKIKSKRINL